MIDTKLTVGQIQVAVAEAFGVRNHIIVPNVSWGFFASHEADMVLITKSNYLIEVEIKRSWSDFLADFKKTTTHDEGKVMYKYFAVPESLTDKVKTYLVENKHQDWGIIQYHETGTAWIVRQPKNFGSTDHRKKLFLEEQLAIARLGCMRIWKLKSDLNDKRSTIEYLNDEINAGHGEIVVDKPSNPAIAVDEDKIKTEYLKWQEQFSQTRDLAAKEYAMGRLTMLEELFPDITKELQENG